jgi:hypothetical protein
MNHGTFAEIVGHSANTSQNMKPQLETIQPELSGEKWDEYDKYQEDY